MNNFFDVTPIGKVLKMFNQDMNVFQEMEETYFHGVEMATHILVVFAVLVSVSPLESLIVIPVIVWLLR